MVRTRQLKLADTLLVCDTNDAHTRLSFDKALERYANVRDAVARSVHGVEPDESMWSHIALLSFSYAFNTYKAIGLVLPELYYEAASAMLRQLWEVSLNLHWIERDPDERVGNVLDFTVVEYRRLLELRMSGFGQAKMDDPPPAKESLDDFDRATSKYQSGFRDKKGRLKRHASFSAVSIKDRSTEIGAPWDSEYQLLYHLASMHAHGASGAVLRPLFLSVSGEQRAKEEDASSLVAISAMAILVRNTQLLVRQGLIPDSEEVDAALGEIGCP